MEPCSSAPTPSCCASSPKRSKDVTMESSPENRLGLIGRLTVGFGIVGLVRLIPEFLWLRSVIPPVYWGLVLTDIFLGIVLIRAGLKLSRGLVVAVPSAAGAWSALLANSLPIFTFAL